MMNKGTIKGETDMKRPLGKGCNWRFRVTVVGRGCISLIVKDKTTMVKGLLGSVH